MPTLRFDPFHVDLDNEQLWRDSEVIQLTHKAFAVLRILLERPGQLVTKEELFDTVWSDTYVTEAALTVCISELRQRLGDRARAPQFIATIYGRGYRFIAPVSVVDQPLTPRETGAPRRPVRLVDREAELAQMSHWFDHALGGERQIGFITGEAGIGKTTLVDAFVEQIRSEAEIRIGHGQCIEHYGAGEAYLPVLEALGRLCRGSEGESLIASLAQHAPSWLIQMPTLLSEAELAALQPKAAGVTQQRMLREWAEAIETLTIERPLVLVLEDLHWSDHSTLELLAFAARRREAARLLVLGTYRPVEVIIQGHPLRRVKQELHLHRLCEELALEYLSEAGVSAYLLERFAHRTMPDGLARVIRQRTNGNPLFIVNMVDALVRQGLLREDTGGLTLRGGIESVAIAVPEGLQHMIEHQLEQVSPEDQEVLETASAVGAEFSSATIAAAVNQTEEKVEAHCDALSRREQFVQARGTAVWPDGSVTARYSFIHPLYQEVLYNRIPVSRRVRLHQRIGARQEAAYGEQAREMAAELAVHFARGQEPRRAIRYLRYAGENAVRRSAYQEAIIHLNAGIEMLQTLPDTSERTQQEIVFQMTLGSVLMASRGISAPEVAHTYARARQLCEQEGETPRLFRVLWGLFMLHFARAELRTAQDLAEQLLDLAQRLHDPSLMQEAHQSLGQILYWQGAFVAAYEQVESSAALDVPQEHRAQSMLYKQEDPQVVRQSFAAWLLWTLGYPNQALTYLHNALSPANEPVHPHSMARGRVFAAMLYQYLRDVPAMQTQAEAVVTLSTEHELPLWHTAGTFLLGWVLTMQGQEDVGLEQMRQGIADWRTLGMETWVTHLLTLLAEAYCYAGQIEAGLDVIAEALALVEQHEERFCEVELYRLKGELLLASQPRGMEAEICFRHALEVAREQHAKSLQLRAAMSLSRLWQRQGKRAEAQLMLADIYEWFTEGFDTADLREAKTLLERLRA